MSCISCIGYMSEARASSISYPFFGDGGTEFFKGEIRRLAEGNQLPLPGGDLSGDGGNLRGNAQRDGLDTVQVAMQQIPRLDL